MHFAEPENWWTLSEIVEVLPPYLDDPSEKDIYEYNQIKVQNEILKLPNEEVRMLQQKPEDFALHWTERTNAWNFYQHIHNFLLYIRYTNTDKVEIFNELQGCTANEVLLTWNNKSLTNAF